MKPRIFVSASNTPTLNNYRSAIETCGAEAEIYFSKVHSAKNYDALLLCGGGDIDPSFFNEENNGTRSIDKQRDMAELELISNFFAANKPIFGVCRGMQVINVYFGGTLIQDLENKNIHSVSGQDAYHIVSSKPGSIVSRLYGKSFKTNSAHHQACKATGSNLIITSSWNDEIAESLEHISAPVFAVQWHPERLMLERKVAGCTDGKVIFEYFIELCKN